MLTTREVMTLLNVSEGTIWCWRRSRKITSVLTPSGKRRLYPASQFAAMLSD